MRRILCGIACVGLLAALAPSAAAASADTGPLVQVSGPSPFADCPPADLDEVLPRGEVEPNVAVNPTNPANVVGVWMQDRFRGLVAGVSLDGGATWRQVVIPGLTRCTGARFDYAFDPWVSFGPGGNLYLSASVFNDEGAGGILVSRSPDGGVTWSDPVPLIAETDPMVEDHGDSITADPTDADLVYAVWTHFPAPKREVAVQGPAFFAQSSDGGATWRRARPIFDPGPNKLTTGNEIVVLPDGRLVNGFTLIAVGAPGQQQPQASVAVIGSTNQGRSWSGATVVDQLQTVGTTDPQTGDPVAGGNLLTDLAVDPASGRLYLVWQDARFNDGRADGIALSSSADGGSTWTTPVKVNATPTGIPIGNQQAFTPSVAVAADGTVAVSYFDFRHNDQGVPLVTDRWLVRCHPTAEAACTTPAGFGDEVRLTDASFDLRRAPQLVGQGGPEGFYLGDSMGLTGAGGGFLALFSQPHGSDPASVFARRVDHRPEMDASAATAVGVAPAGRPAMP
jgi:hypothetical protein